MSDLINMNQFTPSEYDRIRSFLAKYNAKIRVGSKTIINTKTMVLKSLPTIEVKVEGHKFMPLDFGGACFFDTSSNRDIVISKINGLLTRQPKKSKSK